MAVSPAAEAATFPLNAMTMVFALFHETGLNLRSPFGADKDECDYSAESILIIGGGSATGNFGVQLARLAKFGNIIVVASKAREAQLKGLGATTVIDRALDESQIENQIRDVVGDDLVFAVDCVGRGPGGQTLGAKALSSHKKGVLAALIKLGDVDESRIGSKFAGYPTTFQVVDGLDVETVDAFLDNYSRGLGQTKPHFHLGNTFEW
ncbi:hypothetical protein Brms1b_010444 [Colletotrichum noveboracense]|nr:hypothetical protein Brms1b_010444 [Colletotrichum noveboracense]